MTNKDIYKIWAPVGKRWVDWVRPVPFLLINNKTSCLHLQNLAFPHLSYLDKNNKNTAIIVDLLGSQSVDVGIALAEQFGYRPIPIYNGIMEQEGARSTSNNWSIANNLVWGAYQLINIDISDDAPPAFLTDSNRLRRYKLDCSIFDNSWDVYHQDLPTEDYFLNNGISQILVISNDGIAKDLKKIFEGYSKNKISIFWTDGYHDPKCIKKGR